MEELSMRLIEYHGKLADAMNSMDSKIIDEVIRVLHDGITCQNIFIIGNGGNAAIASHIACDLQKGFWNTTANIESSNVMSLCDNAALITAWANDDNFEYIYSQQIERLASRCDILIALSASGNSNNILNAVNQARNMDVETIGISGFNGGKLAETVQHPIVIKSDDMQIIEDVTMILGHFIYKDLIKRLTL